MEEGGEDVRPLKIPRRSTVLMRRARSEVPSGKPEITPVKSDSVRGFDAELGSQPSITVRPSKHCRSCEFRGCRPVVRSLAYDS